MQKGISVELPVTKNAVAAPDAEKEDALVVTVTHDGNVYFGIDPISIDALAIKLKNALSSRTEKTLYIKADARVPYASLMKVLDTVRTAGVQRLTLLTAQRNLQIRRTRAPPNGLEMLIVRPGVAGSFSGIEAK